MAKRARFLPLLMAAAAAMACNLQTILGMGGVTALSSTQIAGTQTGVAAAATATAAAATARAFVTGTDTPVESATASATPSDAPTGTPTPTPVPSATTAPALHQFTAGDAAGLLVQPPDAQEFKFSKIITFGPGQPLGFKDWFGSATDAQPFIDDGLSYISMVGSISGPSPCTKVCFFVSSAAAYTGTLDAAKAEPLMLDYELRLNKTNKELAPEEISALINGFNLSNTVDLKGVTGTSGTGQFAEKTITFFGAYSNVILVAQAGGVPDAITPSDVSPFYKDMLEHAMQAK